MANILNSLEHVNRRQSSSGRVVDFVFATLGLIALAPILCIIALLIKITSPGPVFYRAKRVGKDAYLFNVYKFRTMYVDADRRGPAITQKNDPRVTPVGRFLRMTKLDELPQLINVFLGQMSLVGPRPEDPRYVALYTPEQREVLTFRPGITSPASVEFCSEEELISGDDWEKVYCDQILPRKLAVDLNYLRQRTIWSDIGVILTTFTRIFAGRANQFSSSKLQVHHILLSYLASLAMMVRNRHILLVDICAITLIAALDLPLRLGTLELPLKDIRGILLFISIALPLKVYIFYKLGLYNRYWQHAGVGDLVRVTVGVALSTFLLTLLFVGLYPLLERYDLVLYRTIPLIDGSLTLLAVAGSRFTLRGILHWYRYHQRTFGGEGVLLVGGGETGIMVLRAIQASPQLNMIPIAFVDDDPSKVGSYIEGLPVIGTTYEIEDLASRFQFQHAIVTLSNVPLGRQQEIMATCRRCGITPLSLPATYEFLAGHKTVSPFPQVDLAQLLNREVVNADHSEVAVMLRGKVVLVTGAGGSIGSELCRQIAPLEPAEIILLGHGENSIFEIALSLRISFPRLVTRSLIVDVRDQRRVNWAIQNYRPQVIFHAAAHKHVSLMENSCEEAVLNNVLGTQNVLLAGELNGVERFVMVSSDKAVNPSSIMGVTKRLSELLISAAAQRTGKAYMSVRFGNVLGSRGSVIRIFQQQIAAGAPLTITHADMRRFFMTIPEAVELLLQAAVIGHGGDIYLLDMGEQIRIVDLATRFIRLCGLEPGRDIKIVFGNISPGEKLSEELFLESEKYQRTKHEKIFVSTRTGSLDAQVLEQLVSELIVAAQNMERQTVIDLIHRIVPEYRHISNLAVVSTPRQELNASNGFSKEITLAQA